MKLTLLFTLASYCTGLTVFSVKHRSQRTLRFQLKHTRSACSSLQKLSGECITLYNAFSQYTFNLEIGIPPKKVEVLVDTGTSDFIVVDTVYSGPLSENNWEDRFDPTRSKTFRNNYTDYIAQYTKGKFHRGHFGQDVTRFGEVMLFDFNFAIICQGNREITGRAGLGLSSGEMPYKLHQIAKPYSNLPWQLKEQGHIVHTSYSLWLNSWTQDFGTLIFGGFDTNLIDGHLYTFPIVESLSGLKDQYALQVNELFLVNSDGSQQKFHEGAFPMVLDSGTAITGMPIEYIYPFYEGLGARFTISGTPLVRCSMLAEGGGIGLLINGVEIIFPFTDISVPNDPNSEQCIPGVVRRSSAVMGVNFLRTLYVIYDLENLELGIALANTASTLSLRIPKIQSITDSIPGTKAPLYSATNLDKENTLFLVSFGVNAPPEGEDIVMSRIVMGDARGGCRVHRCVFTKANKIP